MILCGLRRIAPVMTGGSRAIGGCESCQAGNRAALSSLTDVPRGCLPRTGNTVYACKILSIFGCMT